MSEQVLKSNEDTLAEIELQGARASVIRWETGEEWLTLSAPVDNEMSMGGRVPLNDLAKRAAEHEHQLFEKLTEGQEP